ncbi:hypothetical protein BJ912DRAFT_619306 [Pholiota molesta]|nr:hypothetical protein BJ912DRAFT_619306 [Pholiota molesta]
MGSVRRISLVGKHKRTKSGSGFGLGSVPPSPSSPFFSRHASSGTPASGRGEVPPLPYALPPLHATSTSQLSLRLPSSSSTGYLPLPPHPLALGGKRIVSTASSQSQGSSVLPASSSSASTQTSTSASSSRYPSANHPQAPEGQAQKTPTQPQQQQTPRRPSSRRSRASEEGVRRPSLASSRPSVDFEARIRRSIDQEISEGGKEDGQALRKASSSVAPCPQPPVPPMPLLPPIELQPPSPPQTIGPATSATQKPPPLQSDAMASGSLGAPLNSLDSLSPATSSSSLFFTPTSSPPKPSSPTKLAVSQSPSKSPASQQSASLGRVAAATAAAAEASGQGSPTVPRRNSLGDLKIPARISQAQVGIKRDLGLVREFANSVDQLKELQETYHGLVAEIQLIFESHIQRHVRETPSPLPRTTSPSFFANLATKARPKTRARSNTNPTPGKIATSDSPSMQDVTTAQFAYKEMAAAFYTINSKYRISWECAELLIELGGGTPASATSPPPSSASVPLMMQAQAAAFENAGKKKSRERAVTLAGDHSKPYSTASTSLVGSASLPTSPPHLNVSSPPPASPPNMSWRASTGRHDLSQRQLVLLREMLNNTNATSIADESHLSIPEESLPSLHSLHAANKDWRWGDARNSTITLPSEESGVFHHDRLVSAEKKRKGGKLGMAGIRDMLRALKRNRTEGDAGMLANYPPSTAANGPMTKVLHSTASLSTESSAGSKSHRYAHPRLPSNRRRAKTSAGPDTLRASHDLDSEIAATSPFVNPSFAPKPSARRPSLASIFRIGNKHRSPHVTPDDPIMSVPSSSAVPADEHQAHSSGTGEDSNSLSDEEDWDRMDSASDLDAVARHCRRLQMALRQSGVVVVA